MYMVLILNAKQHFNTPIQTASIEITIQISPK